MCIPYSGTRLLQELDILGVRNFASARMLICRDIRKYYSWPMLKEEYTNVLRQ